MMMSPRPRPFFAASCIAAASFVALSATVLAAAADSPGPEGGDVELAARFVTSWDPHPVVQLAHPDPLEINGVRYRVLPGNRRTADWTNCRVISLGRIMPGGARPWDDPRATWRAPVSDLPPGIHRVEFDLRTPSEAIFVEHDLDVPQVARFAGTPPTADGGTDEFPQARYGTIAQDGDAIWFAWDRDALYAATLDGSTTAIRIDLVPAKPGTVVHAFRVPGFARVPWTDLRPADGHLGLKFTVQVRGEETPRTLLLAGSGLPMWWHSNVVSGGPGHDDQGPPVPVLESLKRMTGFNLNSFGYGIYDVYGETDPGDDLKTEFDFSSVRRNPNLWRGGEVVAGVGTFAEWGRDREYDPTYWAVVDPFVEAYAAEMAQHGVSIFSAGYNEPELFYRGDREAFFVNDLTHAADAIRRGCPDAKIIAGKFSGGDPNIIRNFFAAGFDKNFDILDIHPYSNDPRTGCDMGGVVASHETLEDLGVGDRRIYLGEGWGPGRDLHQSDRNDYAEDVYPAEADYMRQFFHNGYRCLVTPRDDYNPEWVWGARFFTLNDNMGSTYWRYNATPHTNEVGEVDYWLLSHLRFGDVSQVKPSFWDGGLVDFQGRPKGDWFFDFPPALPRVFVRAEPAFDLLLPGREEELMVIVVNGDDEPVTNLELGIRSRTYKWEGELLADSDAEIARDTLMPGEEWRIPVRVAASEDSTRGAFRIALEVDYDLGDTRYLADAIARTEISDPISATFDPQRIVLEADETATVRAVYTNHSPTPLAVPAAFTSEEGVEVRPVAGPDTVELDPGESARIELAVSWPDGLPGVADIRPDEAIYEGITVRRPFPCPYLEETPKIDGDLGDWPETGDGGHVVLGRRISLGDLPESVPFPLPPPPKESALGRSDDDGDKTADADTGDAEPRRGASRGPRAFGAEIVFGWNEDGLLMGIVVEDPEHSQEHFGLQIWRGDSIQVAIDPLNNGAGIRTVTPGEYLTRVREEGYSADDHEFGLALTRSATTFVRIHGPFEAVKGPVTTGDLAVRRLGGSTVYEVLIPWAEIDWTPSAGDRIAADVLVNNFDGENRSTAGWADAIGAGKFPSRHIPVDLLPPPGKR